MAARHRGRRLADRALVVWFALVEFAWLAVLAFAVLALVGRA